MQDTTEQAQTTEITKTILDQLGGRRFVMMTGANAFSAHGTTLCFRIPKARKSINRVEVTLTPEDLYTIVFARIRAGKATIVEEVPSVFWDDLQRVFTEVTGLDTNVGAVLPFVADPHR